MKGGFPLIPRVKIFKQSAWTFHPGNPLSLSRHTMILYKN